MSDIKLSPCKLKGEVKVPSSKSVGHRAIIAASLAKGKSVVRNLNMSEDIEATIECMRKLGTEILEMDDTVHIEGTNTLKIKEDVVLDARESGSTLRFLMPLSMLTQEQVKFVGRGRLMERPQKPYFDLFSHQKTEDSVVLTDTLKSGKFELPGDISSQFITGLLYTLPNLDGDSEIILTTELESKGYIDLSIEVLKDFGIEIQNNNYTNFIIKGNQEFKPREYEVESDFSRGCILLGSK